MANDETAAKIVAAAEEARRALFELELGIEREIDALRTKVFLERRELSEDERAHRTRLRASQTEIRQAHVELAHVTLTDLDDSRTVRSLNARIRDVNEGMADDLEALKHLDDLAGKVADVTDKLGRVVGKIAARLT